MTQIAAKNLTVGQEVAVARSGSWNISSLGVYTVTKVNKMQAELVRKGDGYTKTVSVKTDRFADFEGKFTERDTFIEDLSSAQARQEAKVKEQDRRLAWKELEQAGASKNIEAARAAMAKLEEIAKSA
jgi:hypothetical protein